MNKSKESKKKSQSTEPEEHTAAWEIELTSRRKQMKSNDDAKRQAIIRECYAIHEALLRLGFKPENIWIAADAMLVGQKNKDTKCVTVQLQAQGREFNCAVAALVGTKEEFMQAWETFVNELRSKPEAELVAIWESSEVYHNKVRFVTGLLAKGFELPKDNKNLDVN